MARNAGRTVYIGNLDEKVSERILYEILIQAGPVIDLRIPFDKENIRLKGYAFAEYETEEIAQYAVKLFSGLVRINDKALKFVVAGHDKPSSDGKNTHDMPVSHTPAYPVVTSRIAGYGFYPTPYPYGVHPQALSGGPVHNHGQVSNGMYDYSKQAFGSALNIAHISPVMNAFAQGAVNQPIMYPSY